jgi:hypothetical protein
LVTFVECDIDGVVQTLRGVYLARCITYRLEHRNRGVAPNPLLPGDESERGVDSCNYRLVGWWWRSFGLAAG